MRAADDVVLEMHNDGGCIQIYSPRAGDILYTITHDRGGFCRPSITTFYRGQMVLADACVQPYAIVHGSNIDIIEEDGRPSISSMRSARSDFLQKAKGSSIFAP